jgi:SAM-dependent methyltransferase
VIDPITRRFLIAAGVEPGMRVLDVGSGTGDVAFLAADLVGNAGSVTGVDRSADAVTAASAAATARGYTNVAFALGDLNALSLTGQFDAIIGRYVLQWLPDPSGTLVALMRHACPGGLVVFHELDWSGAASHPTAPLWDATCRWVAETILRSGAEIRGTNLWGTFERAGLGPPTMRLEAVMGAGPDADPIDLVADLALTVMPAAEQFGIVAMQELDPGTLHERLRAEATATAAVLTARTEIGAWVRF